MGMKAEQALLDLLPLKGPLSRMISSVEGMRQILLTRRPCTSAN